MTPTGTGIRLESTNVLCMGTGIVVVLRTGVVSVLRISFLRNKMIKISPYQIVAILGSLLLVVSGIMRFGQSGNPKELLIGLLYFIANIIIFCF